MIISEGERERPAQKKTTQKTNKQTDKAKKNPILSIL